MKKYFSRLFCADTYFNISYVFSIEKGLSPLTNIKEKRKSTHVCLLERGSYWQAERQYKNINIIDLPKLIKAEVATISPFPGRVFWKIKSFSSTQVSIIYVAVPIAYVELIAEKCNFLYPLSLDNPTLSDTSDLVFGLGGDNYSVTDYAQDIVDIKNKNLFTLAGFYLFKNKAEDSKVQRLSLKKLILISITSVTFFVVISSAYLGFNLNYLKDAALNNRTVVEQALKTQRELKIKFESKQELDQFFKDNRNVFAILSQLSFKDEKYTIDRVHLHPKGFEISGTSETSATNLLTLLLKEPSISEAKFSRSVSKNRNGDDVFVITAVFS